MLQFLVAIKFSTFKNNTFQQQLILAISVGQYEQSRIDSLSLEIQVPPFSKSIRKNMAQFHEQSWAFPELYALSS